MAQQVESMALQVGYGYNLTHVELRFSVPVKNFYMRPDEARAMIQAIEESLVLQQKMLAEQSAKAS